MTKDYAKKRRTHLANSAKGRYARTTKHSSLWPAWIWVGLGLISGLSISILVYWQNRTPTHISEKVTFEIEDNGKASVHASKRKKSHIAKDEPAARFDFYKLLPNLAVENSGDESWIEKDVGKIKLTDKQMLDQNIIESSHANVQKNMQALANTPSSLASFVIQAGSFRHLPQAEELKAKLAMTGFQASIQTINISEKGTWFRVTIGPFDNREAAKTQQEKLEQAFKLHSVLIKNRV